MPRIADHSQSAGLWRSALRTEYEQHRSVLTILTTAGVNPPDDIESRDLTNLVAGVNPDGTIAQFGRRAINPFSFVIAANSSVELLVVMWCTNSMIWRPIHLRNEISSTMQIGAQPLMLCVRSWTRGIKNNTTRGVPE